MKTLTECKKFLLSIKGEFNGRYCQAINPTCENCPFLLDNNKCISELLYDCAEDLETAIDGIMEKII